LPMSAQEQRVVVDERRAFQKHVLHFQHRDSLQGLLNVGDSRPELVLVNSHDRSSAYQMHAGMYRLICSNGMVVSDSTFERVSIRHTGSAAADVAEASVKLVENIPAIVAKVAQLKARIMTPAEIAALSITAATLRFGDDCSLWPIRAAMLLTPKRHEDNRNDLWTVYNRIQENLIKGGVKDYSIRKPDGKRFGKTRAVVSIATSLDINKKLWDAAVSFAE